MIPILHIASLFIFLLILIYFKIINVYSNNYITQKILIFFTFITFNLLLLIISSYIKKCSLTLNELGTNSMIVALLAVIGYSITTDLHRLEWTKQFFDKLAEYTIIYSLTITSIILGFTSISTFITKQIC